VIGSRVIRAAAFVLMALTSPALAQAPAVDRHAAAERLLDALKSAPTEQTAALVEAHILELWLGGATPAVRLLLSRAAREQQAGASRDAVEDFSAALTLQPDLADAWRQRAEARFAAGDVRGAITDLGESVRREPREFLAIRTLARIAEARGDWKGAYQAWGKLLAFDPKTPGGAQRLKEVRRKALGEET
jgi:tetratricopeptide (TPR) repeat protein